MAELRQVIGPFEKYSIEVQGLDQKARPELVEYKIRESTSRLPRMIIPALKSITIVPMKAL